MYIPVLVHTESIEYRFEIYPAFLVADVTLLTRRIEVQ
jgi:hypothetical protein